MNKKDFKKLQDLNNIRVFPNKLKSCWKNSKSVVSNSGNSATLLLLQNCTIVIIQYFSSNFEILFWKNCQLF